MASQTKFEVLDGGRRFVARTVADLVSEKLVGFEMRQAERERRRKRGRSGSREPRESHEQSALDFGE